MGAAIRGFPLFSPSSRPHAVRVSQWRSVFHEPAWGSPGQGTHRVLEHNAGDIVDERPKWEDGALLVVIHDPREIEQTELSPISRGQDGEAHDRMDDERPRSRRRRPRL